MFTQKLIIKEFAQFKDITIDVDDVLLLIGEQATGKSTLLKWVYFFKQVKQDIIQRIYTELEDFVLSETYDKLLELFDNNENDFAVKYEYSKGFFMEIFYSKKFSKHRLLFTNQIEFQDIIEEDFKNQDIAYLYDYDKKITSIVLKIEQYHKKFNMQTEDYALLDLQEKRKFDRNREIEKNKIDAKIYTLFGNDNTIIFIPTYRGAGEFIGVKSNLPIELRLSLYFARRLQSLYPAFDKGFLGLIERKKRLTAHKKASYNKNFEYAEEARKLIENGILKGNYSHGSSNGSGKLTTANNTTVSIFNASSGQQETLGMMIVIFLAILNGEATTLFIEEPEVHLYPTAQKTLVDLFCLFLNANEGNKLYLSTHSPYILTSFNNLLYAHQLREKLQKLPPEKQIIKPYYWLDFQRLRAYQLQNGEVLDIRDLELGLIQAENIDKAASQQINGIFDQLFNLENE